MPPTPTATVNSEQALATATASYAKYVSDLDKAVGMSRDDYVRLVARPIARQKATTKLTEAVTDVQPQLRAVHILLATKEGAEQARQQVLKDPGSFASVAREQSTDTTTNQTGGDLGWFPRGVLVKEFEDVAFALPLNEVSEPVQTKYGWHLIKAIEKSDTRPLTEGTLTTLKDGAFQKWLDTQKAKAKVTTTVAVTPTPARETFSPPPDAPPTPTRPSSRHKRRSPSPRCRLAFRRSDTHRATVARQNKVTQSTRADILSALVLWVTCVSRANRLASSGTPYCAACKLAVNVSPYSGRV